MESFLQKTREEDKPYRCRALSTSRKNANNLPRTRTSSLSSFTYFTIMSQPRIRIKIPKLLSKAMHQRRNSTSSGNETDGSADRSKRYWPRHSRSNLLPPKKAVATGSPIAFSNVFGNEKSPEISYPTTRAKDGNIQRGGGKSSSASKTLRDYCIEEEEIRVSADHERVDEQDSLKILENIGDGKEKHGGSSLDHGHKFSSKEESKEGFLSFSNIFLKRSGLRFFKGASRCGGKGKQQSSSSTSSKMSRGREKAAIIDKRTEKESEKKEEDQEDGEKLSLCKKRILMGGRCRPLHQSGALHYDENGLLLPEPEECIPFDKELL